MSFDSVEQAAAAVEELAAQIEDPDVLAGRESLGLAGREDVALAEFGQEADPTMTLADLFTRPFVRHHTDAESLDAFLAESPLVGGDTDASRHDAYVANHSEFDSWAEMVEAAKVAWLEREFGLL